MSYKDKYAESIERQFYDLENRIISDIIRRIKKTGEITSTADWQINKLMQLGYSSDDIESIIKTATKRTWPEMFELYDKVIDWEYVRNKKIYEQINGAFIPYEENTYLQQLIGAAKVADEEHAAELHSDYGDSPADRRAVYVLSIDRFLAEDAGWCDHGHHDRGV